MKSDIALDVIETHTEGQVVRTVTGGIDTNRLTGTSVSEKVTAFDEQFGWVRELLTKEPRGHSNLVGGVPVAAESEDADIGYIFFDNSIYYGNCGDGVIGTTTALIETGILDPRRELTIEVPAGLVETEVRLTDDGHVDEVAIQGMESFTHTNTTATVNTESGETVVPVDIAYGGNWFGFVDADALDLSLTIDDADPDRIIDYGLQIRQDVNERIDIINPLTNESERVSITMFIETNDEAVDRGTIVYAAGSIGRSPCGTGTAAQLSRLYDDNALDIGDNYSIASLFDTQFTGRILDVEKVGDTRVTKCEVAGSAHIIAKQTYLRDPTDDLESFLI